MNHQLENGKTQKPVSWRADWLITLLVAGASGAWLGWQMPELSPGSGELRAPAQHAQQHSTSLSGSYLAGHFAAAHYDFSTAARFALQAHRSNPQIRKVALKAFRLQVLAGNLDEAEPLAVGILTHNKGDLLAIMVEANRLAQEKDYETAAALLEKAEARGVFGLLKPLAEQWLKLGAALKDERQKKPVNMADLIENSGFLSPFVYYQQALMNDLAGFSKEASRNYDAATAPKAGVPYRMIQAAGNFYLRQGKPDKVKALYARYNRQNPEAGVEPEWPLEAGTTPPTPLVPDIEAGLAEIYFTAASLLFSEQANQETLIYLRFALALQPDFHAARMMMASVLEQFEAYNEAIASYQQIPPASGYYAKAVQRMAIGYRALEQEEKAIALLQTLIDKDPSQVEAAILLGDMYRIRENYSHAIPYYQKAIERSDKQDPQRWEYFYKRGMAFERSGLWEQAEADLQESLRLNPEEADVLNYLGYSWLEKGKQVEEALKLIKRAFEARPDETHIVDSMGWAYFMIGEYEKSLELLEIALEQAPQDPTLNDHLGDVYWQTGRRQEARFQWKRALEFDPDNQTVIQKKIESGLEFTPILPSADVRKLLSLDVTDSPAK